tara:strand:+ start:390 stop:521 length:132 start_codon:yes stop_codon:yes gene_type:complete
MFPQFNGGIKIISRLNSGIDKMTELSRNDIMDVALNEKVFKNS